MARLDEPVMNTSRRAPAANASSTAYWISGLSTMGSISLGDALVAGRKRVPRPATGNTAVRMRAIEVPRRNTWPNDTERADKRGYAVVVFAQPATGYGPLGPIP